MFAAAVASIASTGGSPMPAGRPTWGPFNARIAQHSRHTVAMDKRAATKARNVKRNKA